MGWLALGQYIEDRKQRDELSRDVSAAEAKREGAVGEAEQQKGIAAAQQEAVDSLNGGPALQAGVVKPVDPIALSDNEREDVRQAAALQFDRDTIAARRKFAVKRGDANGLRQLANEEVLLDTRQHIMNTVRGLHSDDPKVRAQTLREVTSFMNPYLENGKYTVTDDGMLVPVDAKGKQTGPAVQPNMGLISQYLPSYINMYTLERTGGLNGFLGTQQAADNLNYAGEGNVRANRTNRSENRLRSAQAANQYASAESNRASARAHDANAFSTYYKLASADTTPHVLTPGAARGTGAGAYPDLNAGGPSVHISQPVEVAEGSERILSLDTGSTKGGAQLRILSREDGSEITLLPGETMKTHDAMEVADKKTFGPSAQSGTFVVKQNGTFIPVHGVTYKGQNGQMMTTLKFGAGNEKTLPAEQAARMRASSSGVPFINDEYIQNLKARQQAQMDRYAGAGQRGQGALVFDRTSLYNRGYAPGTPTAEYVLQRIYGSDMPPMQWPRIQRVDGNGQYAPAGAQYAPTSGQTLPYGRPVGAGQGGYAAPNGSVSSGTGGYQYPQTGSNSTDTTVARPPASAAGGTGDSLHPGASPDEIHDAYTSTDIGEPPSYPSSGVANASANTPSTGAGSNASAGAKTTMASIASGGDHAQPDTTVQQGNEAPVNREQSATALPARREHGVQLPYADTDIYRHKPFSETRGGKELGAIGQKISDLYHSGEGKEYTGNGWQDEDYRPSAERTPGPLEGVGEKAVDWVKRQSDLHERAAAAAEEQRRTNRAHSDTPPSIVEEGARAVGDLYRSGEGKEYTGNGWQDEDYRPSAERTPGPLEGAGEKAIDWAKRQYDLHERAAAAEEEQRRTNRAHSDTPPSVVEKGGKALQEASEHNPPSSPSELDTTGVGGESIKDTSENSVNAQRARGFKEQADEGLAEARAELDDTSALRARSKENRQRLIDAVVADYEGGQDAVAEHYAQQSAAHHEKLEPARAVVSALMAEVRAAQQRGEMTDLPSDPKELAATITDLYLEDHPEYNEGPLTTMAKAATSPHGPEVKLPHAGADIYRDDGRTFGETPLGQSINAYGESIAQLVKNGAEFVTTPHGPALRLPMANTDIYRDDGRTLADTPLGNSVRDLLSKGATMAFTARGPELRLPMANTDIYRDDGRTLRETPLGQDVESLVDSVRGAIDAEVNRRRLEGAMNTERRDRASAKKERENTARAKQDAVNAEWQAQDDELKSSEDARAKATKDRAIAERRERVRLADEATWGDAVRRLDEGRTRVKEEDAATRMRTDTERRLREALRKQEIKAQARARQERADAHKAKRDAMHEAQRRREEEAAARLKAQAIDAWGSAKKRIVDSFTADPSARKRGIEATENAFAKKNKYYRDAKKQ